MLNCKLISLLNLFICLFSLFSFLGYIIALQAVLGLSEVQSLARATFKLSIYLVYSSLFSWKGRLNPYVHMGLQGRSGIVVPSTGSSAHFPVKSWFL